MPQNRKRIAGKQNKIQALSTQLRQLAYEKGPAAKMPTVREICDVFGVSKGTVEDALGTLEAQRIISRKQGSGIYVAATLHRKTISILVNSSFFHMPGTSPFWGNLLFLLTEEAQRRSMTRSETFDFHLITSDANIGDPLYERFASSVSTGQIHGVISVGASVQVAEWIEQQEIPCVAFASAARLMVGMDSAVILRSGMETLVASGCRRIAYLAPVAPLQPIEFHSQRSEELREALAQYGLPFYAEFVKDYRSPRSDGKTRIALTHQQQGYLAGIELFDSGVESRPDGLISTDDMMTSGLLAALHKLGLRPGRDVCIVTHANVGSSVLFGDDENLTRIESDPMDITQRLFALLDELMKNPDQPHQLVLIAPRVRPAT